MCYTFNDFVYYVCVYVYINKMLETCNLFPVFSGQAQVLCCSYTQNKVSLKIKPKHCC